MVSTASSRGVLSITCGTVAISIIEVFNLNVQSTQDRNTVGYSTEETLLFRHLCSNVELHSNNETMSCKRHWTDFWLLHTGCSKETEAPAQCSPSDLSEKFTFSSSRCPHIATSSKIRMLAPCPKYAEDKPYFLFQAVLESFYTLAYRRERAIGHMLSHFQLNKVG